MWLGGFARSGPLRSRSTRRPVQRTPRARSRWVAWHLENRSPRGFGWPIPAIRSAVAEKRIRQIESAIQRIGIDSLSPWPHREKDDRTISVRLRQSPLAAPSMDIPVDPIPDLAKVLHDRFGWPSDPQIILEGSSAPSLNALVGRDSHGYPRVVEKPGRPDSRHYRLARALYFVPVAEASVSPRLITRSFTWDQQASRAFAAELLAPAEALRHLVDERNTDESIANLAQEFNVSTWVIEHQLENHGIASFDS